ncbi:MAG: hypothetical protein KF712_06025 [Akkermansiaceae bacterium]|nr:hypothetical protein [Akkermansiaceae bacterium]
MGWKLGNGMSSALLLAGGWMVISSPLHGQEPLEEIRKTAATQVEESELSALFKEAELSTRYLAALDALEKKLAAEGNLDLIVRLREERDAIKESGTPTAHADKELVELRGKYLAARKVIHGELAAANAKVAEEVTRKIRAEELVLTKAGKVDDALALRKEGERLLLELVPDTSSAADIPFGEDPKAAGPLELKELPAITVPGDQPPVNANIFSTKGRWLESVTVPAMKQRIRERIIIGDRSAKSASVVVVAPGNVWSSVDGASVELTAGRLVANRARFEKLTFLADLNCIYHFTNSTLEDCGIRKGGNRVGPDHAAKFHFDRCLVKGSLAGFLNIDHHGVRAQSTVFQGIELPGVDFKSKQPASFANHPWMRIVNCRFVNCTIPASFLTLTRDCIFEGCTFVDDKNPMDDAKITRPMEIPLYVSNCKSRISKLSPHLKFVEKPAAELKGVAIPTLESISSMVSP